jgi:DNA-binding NarL/FixJ family response regulator
MVIEVLIADDHGVVRDGVRYLLEAHADIKVVAAVDNGADAVRKTVALRPHVVVLDVAMPGLNGIEATCALARESPETAVVLLSMHSSVELMRQAFLGGARGYLLKESAGSEVASAVRSVAGGQRFLGEGVAGKILAEFPYTPTAPAVGDLTPRERDVVRLIAAGNSNAEAAAKLGLSPRSVETYRLRVMQKLGVENLPALVKFAIRHGITTLE